MLCDFSAPPSYAAACDPTVTVGDAPGRHLFFERRPSGVTDKLASPKPRWHALTLRRFPGLRDPSRGLPECGLQRGHEPHPSLGGQCTSLSPRDVELVRKSWNPRPPVCIIRARDRFARCRHRSSPRKGQIAATERWTRQGRVPSTRTLPRVQGGPFPATPHLEPAGSSKSRWLARMSGVRRDPVN